MLNDEWGRASRRDGAGDWGFRIWDLAFQIWDLRFGIGAGCCRRVFLASLIAAGEQVRVHLGQPQFQSS